MDVVIREVYGQSEGSGPTTFNRPGNTKFGSVGLPYPGTEIKLGTDGEVMVRGGNVFAGYYRNPQATAETIDDGWLLSGDLGSFDSDGFLFITGRKKDIIITAGGKNIAPKDIEAGLKDHPRGSGAGRIGGAFFAPKGKALVARLESGESADKLLGVISRVALVDQVILLVVVWAMVAKPGA